MKPTLLSRLIRANILTLAAAATAPALVSAAEISGYVLDYNTAEPVVDAEVVINGATAKVDSDGFYEIEAPEGQVNVTIEAPNYEPTSKSITAVDGQINNVSVNLLSNNDSSASASDDDDEYATVDVIGRYVPPTAAANERDASAVLDSIGAAELSRTGDSNVASALKRVVGLNLRGGSFVSIRGLDGRYIASSLNGANMPSLNSVRREAPLGVIPSGILEGIDVQKGFTSDLSGLSTGGTVQLTTKKYPLKPIAKYSISLGYNPTVFESDFQTRNQGGLDFLGYDDGTRAIPGSLDQATANEELQIVGKDINGIYTQEEVDELFGSKLPVNYEFKSYNVMPDFGLGLTFGDGFQSFSKVWDYGYLASLSFKNKNSIQSEGQKQQFDDKNSSNASFQSDYEQYKRNIDFSGMLTLGSTYNNNHSVTLNTLLTRKTEERNTVETVNTLETTEDIVDFSDKYSSQWKERMFLINQLLGEHYWGKSKINWGISNFIGTESIPDEISYVYIKRFTADDPLLDSSINRSWFELQDDTLDIYLDYNRPFLIGTSIVDFDIGLSTFNKKRDVVEKNFIVRWTDSGNTDPLIQTDLNNVFTQDSFGDTVSLADNSDLSSRHNGSEDQFAYYSKVSSAFFDSKLAFELGARNETGTIEVESSTATNPSDRLFAKIDYNDVLPFISMKYDVSDDFILKSSFSQTVARPSIRELSASTYVDDDFGLLLQGNPELEASSIQNIDLRGEYYFSDSENISLALFYKDFDKPIQRVARPSVTSTKFDFENQQSGVLSGFEVDFRKEQVIDLGYRHNVFLTGNFAFIDSEVTLTELASQKVGQAKQKFQGQPDYVANLQIGYDELLTQQSLTLLYVITSDQIFAPAESDDLGSIIEEQYAQFDINYTWQAFENTKLKLSAKNILNEEKELTQDGRLFRKYSPGTVFSIGFSGDF